MLFSFDITVPAGTADTAPYQFNLPLIGGMLERLDIKFPAGCHGLVKVVIVHNGAVLVPFSSNQKVTGDDEVIGTPIGILLSPNNCTLRFEASSPNCTYDHVIGVRIEVNPPLTANTTNDDFKIMIGLLEKIALALDTENTITTQPAPPIEYPPYIPPTPTPPIAGGGVGMSHNQHLFMAKFWSVRMAGSGGGR